jgi:hypothetical protein
MTRAALESKTPDDEMDKLLGNLKQMHAQLEASTRVGQANIIYASAYGLQALQEIGMELIGETGVKLLDCVRTRRQAEKKKRTGQAPTLESKGRKWRVWR